MPKSKVTAADVVAAKANVKAATKVLDDANLVYYDAIASYLRGKGFTRKAGAGGRIWVHKSSQRTCVDEDTLLTLLLTQEG